MKVGDIVRRTNVYGNLIGDYLVVTNIVNDIVYARYLSGVDEFQILPSSFRALKTVILTVPDADFKALRYASFYVHSVSKTWDNAVKENDFELAKIRDRHGNAIYLVNPKFYRIVRNQQLCIKMYYDHIICVHLTLFTAKILGRKYHQASGLGWLLSLSYCFFETGAWGGA